MVNDLGSHERFCELTSGESIDESFIFNYTTDDMGVPFDKTKIGVNQIWFIEYDYDTGNIVDCGLYSITENVVPPYAVRIYEQAAHRLCYIVNNILLSIKLSLDTDDLWENGTYGRNEQYVGRIGEEEQDDFKIVVDDMLNTRDKMDALRYRWLRNSANNANKNDPICVVGWGPNMTVCVSDELDNAIDCAMKLGRR